MKRALVLGADGLLGSRLMRDFAQSGFLVFGTSRAKISRHFDNSSILKFQLGEPLEGIFKTSKPDVVVNCIVNKYSRFLETSEMIRVNSIFPRKLLEVSRLFDSFLFLCGTDAVFSGFSGPYKEHQARFPLTTYGFSKCLGDLQSEKSLLLRFSMIATKMDLNVRSQNISGRIANASPGQVFRASKTSLWNGVTVGLVSRLIVQLSTLDSKPTGIRHFFSDSCISKFTLLEKLAIHLDRNDIKVIPRESYKRNSPLSTDYDKDYDLFWSLLGFSRPPEIDNLLRVLK